MFSSGCELLQFEFGFKWPECGDYVLGARWGACARMGYMDSIPRSRLTEVELVFGHPARLRIIRALLPAPGGLGQAALKQETGLASSTLERHARALVTAGVLVMNVPLTDTRRGVPLDYRLSPARYSELYLDLCRSMAPRSLAGRRVTELMEDFG